MYFANYTAFDLAGNSAFCQFNITVTQMAAENLNAGSAGASTAALGGGVGGAGFLLILLVLLVVLMRRNHKKVCRRVTRWLLTQ